MEQGVDGFRVDAVPWMFEDQSFPDEPEDPNRPPEALPDEYRYWSHPYTYNLPAVLDSLAQLRQTIELFSLSDGRERLAEEAGSI
jgi:alpha-glucosidase